MESAKYIRIRSALIPVFGRVGVEIIIKYMKEGALERTFGKEVALVIHGIISKGIPEGLGRSESSESLEIQQESGRG